MSKIDELIDEFEKALVYSIAAQTSNNPISAAYMQQARSALCAELEAANQDAATLHRALVLADECIMHKIGSINIARIAAMEAHEKRINKDRKEIMEDDNGQIGTMD